MEREGTRQGKRREEAEGERERGLDLDICSGPPSS